MRAEDLPAASSTTSMARLVVDLAEHALITAAVRGFDDEFDLLVLQRLGERRDILERLASLRPGDTLPVAPIGWVHGDFHDLNLLWSDEQHSRVTAVLDWDRLRLGPVAAEVIRTATLLFGHDLTPARRALDLERVAAFTAGYRDVTPLPGHRWPTLPIGCGGNGSATSGS